MPRLLYKGSNVQRIQRSKDPISQNRSKDPTFKGSNQPKSFKGSNVKMVKGSKMDKLSNGLHFFLIKFFLHFFLITILLNLDFLLPVRKMEVRSRLVELQKTRKRRLPINETSDLSELQQEANSDDDEIK
ncbi:hypothetical protein ACQ4LE_010333 [Meloidogyne hapla]|uniref:Uncharacterized protein n=1 Tax=Meloidogyne hapla TaxID=6305 RepID=A0A1I8B5K3_MELHA